MYGGGQVVCGGRKCDVERVVFVLRSSEEGGSLLHVCMLSPIRRLHGEAFGGRRLCFYI